MTVVPTAAEAAERRRAGLELMRDEAGDPERIEILATFNLDLLPPFLADSLARTGVDVRVRAGPFGQIGPQILDPSSELYAAAPTGVLLVPAAEDVLRPLFALPPSELTAEGAIELVEEQLAVLEAQVETLLERLPQTRCYLVVFGAAEAPVPHVLDPRAPDRRQAALERYTHGVRELSRLGPNVVLVDWDWHVRGPGAAGLRDERLWYLGRMRLNPVGCAVLADLVARSLTAYRGNARKVVALDLDGTLWGGVVGEVGLAGIELGEDGIGFAYQDFQRELAKLNDTGVLLVACSKNNPDDVAEVFELHSGMILERSQLAAERVNWQDKAANLRELAAELNLGLDSFVFLDDNPVERTWITQALPEVLVPELPADPAERPAFLRAAPWFDRIATTEADRGRTGSYLEQRERRQLEHTASSFDDFLASLEQEAVIERLHDGSLARAAQLLQRTNQFNLTTQRHDQADLERMRSDPAYDIFTLAVRDRFGDSGITGLAILHHRGELTEIDSLLMSCRILGRKLEDVFLAFLAETAASHDATTLVGRFVPTAKNGQAARFYSERGFEEVGDGTFVRRLDEAAAELQFPIAVTVTTGG